MRILFLAPHSFYQVRGSPIAVNLLLNVLSDRGDTVHVLTYHEGQDVDHKQVTLHRIPSLPFVGHVRPGFSWKKLACDFLLGIHALRLQRRHRYDLVYALEESVFIALFLKFLFKTPYVYDMDSSLPQQLVEHKPALAPLTPLLRRCEHMVVKRALAVVPVCDGLARSIQVHGPRKVVTLHDIPLISGSPSNDKREDARGALRTELNLTGGVIMYVGNLEYYQGIDLLLESFRLFLGEDGETRLVIVGGEPDDLELYRRRAEIRAIAHAVHFLGPRPLEDLGDLLHASDVLVSPRLRGINTPMKIYSYLESGKAILATDIQAHTEVLTKDVAMLVPPVPQTLARGMRELMHSDTLRLNLGQAGKRLADERFTYAAYRTAVHELFDWLERE